MRSNVRRFVRRIGRRGSALLFLSLLDVIYAINLAFPPEEAKLSAVFRFVQHTAPLPAWSALWLGVGIACFVGAFLRHDRWAFTAAMALKTLWGTTFLLGWLLLGLDRGYVSAIVWLALASWVYIISTWPEPDAPVVPVEAVEVR